MLLHDLLEQNRGIEGELADFYLERQIKYNNKLNPLGIIAKFLLQSNPQHHGKFSFYLY